jgi:hypothetical protein
MHSYYPDRSVTSEKILRHPCPCRYRFVTTPALPLGELPSCAPTEASNRPSHCRSMWDARNRRMSIGRQGVWFRHSVQDRDSREGYRIAQEFARTTAIDVTKMSSYSDSISQLFCITNLVDKAQYARVYRRCDSARLPLSFWKCGLHVYRRMENRG